MKTITAVFVALATLASAHGASAQEWKTNWKQSLAEAKQSNKLALLLFLCAKFFLNAIEHDTVSSWGVLSGFSLLTLARLAFLLEPLNAQWYVGGHAAQLIGYILLLIVLIQVVRK